MEASGWTVPFSDLFWYSLELNAKEKPDHLQYASNFGKEDEESKSTKDNFDLKEEKASIVPNGSCYIDSLPEGVFAEIFSFFSHWFIMRTFSLVSKKWQQMAKSPLLWKIFQAAYWKS